MKLETLQLFVLFAFVFAVDETTAEKYHVLILHQAY